jgi:hypothetical protein
VSPTVAVRGGDVVLLVGDVEVARLDEQQATEMSADLQAAVLLLLQQADARRQLRQAAELLGVQMRRGRA